MEKSTSASHENDPRFRLPVDTAQQDFSEDAPAEPKRGKERLRLVGDAAEKKVKKADKYFFKRVDSILTVGGKKIDLSINGREPTYPARGKNVLVFAFDTSRFTVFKEGGKLFGQTILFGKAGEPVALGSVSDIVNQIAVFKGNVQFNTRKPEDAGVSGDVSQFDVTDSSLYPPVSPAERPGLLIPLRESDSPLRRDDTRGSSVEKVKIIVDKEFDDLISSPPHGVETVTQPLDESVTPEQKVFINETLADARGTSSELLQSLAGDGKDESYYGSLSVEYSTEDKEAVVRGAAARTYGTSSTGGDGSRYAVPETVPVQHENRTALVGVVTEAGRLGAAVIESTTPRALEGVRGVLVHGLAKERFSLTTVFDGFRRLLSKKAKTGEVLSAAAVTVSAGGEVAMASMGDTAVLMVREGKKLELIDQTEPVQTKDLVAKSGIDAESISQQPFESKTVKGKDHDQIIAATKRFWDLVSEYEVEKYAKRYRGEALQKVLFNLAFDRNNAVVPFVIETSPNEKKYEQPAKGEGSSIALQVTHVELPDQRGFLSKLGRSKAGTWLRRVALVAFGFSAQGKMDNQPPAAPAAIVQADTVRSVEQKAVQTPGRQSTEKITIEKSRGNEHDIVRLVHERNNTLHFLGDTKEDRGRQVLISAWTKQLLRGNDAGGFSAAEFNKNVTVNKQGQFEFKNAAAFDDYLVFAADSAKERKHISTAIGYAEGTYAKHFKKAKDVS